MNPHAAHIRRQIVDLHGALTGGHAILLHAQIHAQALHPRHPLIPFRQRLPINGPDARESLVMEAARERACDKPARPRQ